MTKKHAFDDRDLRLITYLLVDGLCPADIARLEKISRQRVQQLFYRMGVKFRPVRYIPPELLGGSCPERKSHEQDGTKG